MGVLRVALSLILAGNITFGQYALEDFAGGSPDGDDGPATAARFHSMESAVEAPDGTIYIADPAANRLRRIDNLGIIHAFASGGGWQNPYGLAVDTQGNLYVADYGNRRVRRIATDGTITDIAATGLKGPRNVAIATDGTVYISDFDAGVVYEAGASGQLTPLAIGGLGHPAGLTLDSSGALYVTDPSSGVVFRYLSGQSQIWIKNLNTPTGVAPGPNSTLFVTGANMAFTMARLAGGTLAAAGPAAHDAASDGNNGVLLAAGDRLLHIRATGVVETLAGPGTATANSNLAVDAQLNGPIGVATDAQGNVYIAEERASLVRRVDRAGTIQTLQASAAMQDPVAVAVPPTGGLVVAEFAPMRVRSITAAGAVTTLLGSPNIQSPRGLAVDSAGNLYVADPANNRVLRQTPSGQLMVIGGGLLAQPSAVAIDASGGLLVADSGHHMIRRYDPATANWRTLAGNGTAGNTGDGAAASAALLNFPTGVAGGPDGAIYIADTYNYRVRKIGVDGNMQTIAQAPDLNTPSSVAVGIAGEVFVADLGDNRIVRLVPAAAGSSGSGTDVQPVALTIAHAATGAVQALAPGQLFTVSGLTQWDGANLYLNGNQAPILASNGATAFAQVPAGASGTMLVEARRAGAGVGTGSATITSTAPALFVKANGTVAASDNTGALATLSRGSVVSLYGTGEGITPASIRIVFQVTTSSGESLVWDAGVLYAGSASWMPGMLQVNIQVPPTLPAGAVSVALWVGSVQSPPAKTVIE